MSSTFEKTCFGTTKIPLRLTATNSESRVFSVITTVYAPRWRIEAMFDPSRYTPRMSIVLSCFPAVRL
jgi:hypothetical protein